MYALNSAEYEKCTALPPSMRPWVRLWLDGTYSGTHIHWRLSPLSVLGLAASWGYLSRLHRWPQQQQRALIRLAHRRRGTFYSGDMPRVDASIETWHSFFAEQISHSGPTTDAALDWHRKRVASGSLPAAASPELWIALNELYAALSLRGYSSDDLFNRVKDGVIDASHTKLDNDTDRLLGFLDYFSKPTPRAYVVWTTVLADTVWSNTLRRRFSTVRLHHPWDLRGVGPTRVLLSNGSLTPVVVSRVDGTYSVKERHRIGALTLLDDLMRREPHLGQLSLDGTTSMVLLDGTDRAPWRYARKPEAVPLLAAEKVADTDHLRIGQVAMELFDHPERVINEVFRVWEHTGHASFWLSVPPCYHRLLRSDLSRHINAYRLRLGGVFANRPQETVPATVRVIGDVAAIQDHIQLLRLLADDENSTDEVFVARLSEVVTWKHFEPARSPEATVFNTVHEMADLLAVARSFRNALEHSAAVPFELYHVVLYLAGVTLYGFSCVRRDPRHPRI